MYYLVFKQKIKNETCGQDGGVGKHASPPRATTERTTTRP